MELDDALLDHLYAACAAPEAWPEFLSRLAHLMGAQCAGFLVGSPADPQYSIALTLNVPAEVTSSYNAYYGRVDPWRAGIAGLGITAFAGLGETLCSPAAFDESELYNDCWKSLGFRARSQAG